MSRLLKVLAKFTRRENLVECKREYVFICCQVQVVLNMKIIKF